VYLLSFLSFAFIICFTLISCSPISCSRSLLYVDSSVGISSSRINLVVGVFCVFVFRCCLHSCSNFSIPFLFCCLFFGLSIILCRLFINVLVNSLFVFSFVPSVDSNCCIRFGFLGMSSM